MAKELRLTWYDPEGFVTTVDIDLLNGVFQLLDGTWESQDADEPVWETFTLVARGTDAQIRTEQAELDRFIERARMFVNDSLQPQPGILRVKSEGESSKFTFILDGDVTYESDENIGPLLGANMPGGNTGVIVTLALLRTPVWEKDTATTVSIADLSASGGQWSPGNAAGELNQRIEEFILSDDTDPAYTHSKFWVGIKRPRKGMTSIVTTWEMEDCHSNVTPNLYSPQGVDTTEAADASASGGAKITVSFTTTPGLAFRSRGVMNDHLPLAGRKMAGNYLILARVKLDAGTTEVRLQLRQGWTRISTGVPDREIIGDVYVSAVSNPNLTNWNLVELGISRVPSLGDRLAQASTAMVARFGYELMAERISGSGSIDIDCFYLIPVDGYFIATNVKVGKDLGQIGIYTSELNEQWAVGLGSAAGGSYNDHFMIDYQLGNWFYPAEGGMIVVVGQAATQHELGKTVDISMKLYPRYKMFRV